MNKGFEIYKWLGHRFVAGWLEPEVLSILRVLNSAQRSQNVSGAVAEVGVHHGRLFIGLSLLQRSEEYSVAIDLFDDQLRNIDHSGKGDLATFQKNVRRWSSLDNVVIHQGDSTHLLSDELSKLARAQIRLFSVDGGHTDQIVFSDMMLAESTTAPGGIVVADDVFNQYWPGVATGTLRYLSGSGGLVPFAIGFNKVFFSFAGHAEFYRGILRKSFQDRHLLLVKTSEFATHDVLVITRAPRGPRGLISRSETAKHIYHRVQEWSHHRQ
ncbi:class I SAM-dependent methyltransferase [Mycolicibacterium stellerae]|uniref:class I SAM-dependent methyltransferase n=1 Tax=Mycolicibacterium stellerae TaxID=2358193 RepID=UPI000F0B8296|nr:class I SAM-dependent methyltransferase [Mycolicibacterium stellerae]